MTGRTTTIQEHSGRYVAVAAISAVLGNIILIVGNHYGYGTTVLFTFSWFVTGTLTYVLHALFTFRQPFKLGSWLRFLLGAAAGIPAFWLLIQLFEAVIGWPMFVAAPLATGIMFGYHYANARLSIARSWLRLPKRESADRC